MPNSFTSLLGVFFSFLLLYKYWALFLIAFIASLILPIPASTTLSAAGAFASQGYFNILVVLLVALAGNVAGDLVGFILAKKFGEEVLRKIGFGRILRSAKYDKFKDYILDFPGSVIYFSRFLTELGPAVNLLSGLVGVPYKTFLFFDVIGETCYVLLYGLVGYYLGSQWENSLGFFTRAGLIMLSIGAAVNLIQLMLYKKRRKRQS